MIYLNSRPIARKTQPETTKCRFEWRDFSNDNQDSADQIREVMEFDHEETRTERFFLLPGRPNQIAKLNDDKTFEIKTKIDDEGPLEMWETTVKSKVPLQRTLAKSIGARIPKFSGPVVGSMSPEELSESLKKKTRYYKVKTVREVFTKKGVTAKISQAKIGDTNTVSIAFESSKAEPLMELLKTLGLRKKHNTNYGEYLLTQA